MPRLPRFCLIAAWLVAAPAAPAEHRASFSDALTAVCRQLDRQLSCRLLPRGDADISNATLLADGGKELEGELLAPPDGARYAALLLVDTSDPGRAGVVAADRENVRRALAALDPRTAVGVARFDAELETLLPPATARERAPRDVENAVNALQATGRTTEFYRNLISAIRLLGREDAAARALIVMSDGLAEDSAYHHEDAVAAAHREGVTVHGIGHARSVPQSVALQTLRRLSEETGGVYLQADSASHRVPAEYFAAIAAALVKQRSARFDIQALATAPQATTLPVRLSVLAGSERVTLPIEVRLPPAADSAAGTLAPAPIPATVAAPTAASAPSTAAAGAATPGGRSGAMFDWLAVAGLVLLGGYLALRWYRNGSDEAVARPGQNAATADTPRHAFIVMAEDPGRRYAITRTPWRVGRSRSNDLTLEDGSVSRVHAEIHRDELGVFTIQDLDAMNGVFVNDKKVDTAVIDEGDRIDIGDVGLRFTLHGEDYDAQDPTVLLRTRPPPPDATP